MKKDIILNVSKLTKKLKKTTLLNDISFSINENMCCGILGPNGAGKSTLLNLISGYDKKYHGEISICGKKLTEDFLEITRHIGFVPQSENLDHYISALANLKFQMDLYRLPYSKTINFVENLSKRLGIYSKLKNKVFTLSGGEKQKLIIIMALLHNPSILILDEPTFGLDFESRLEIWNIIKSLQKDMNLTILFSTHHLDETEEFCDYVIIVSQGVKLVEGIPSALKNKLGEEIITIKTSSSVISDNLRILMPQKDLFYEDKSILKFTTSCGKEAMTKISTIIKNQKIHNVEISLSSPSITDVYLFNIFRRPA